MTSKRLCFRPPIPEVFKAAQYLDDAVTAHLAGRFGDASNLIRMSDLPEVRAWTESIWGKASPYVKVHPISVGVSVLTERLPQRMPNKAEKAKLLLRDGHHCRFCGAPVIRSEIRLLMKKAYPDDLSWGGTNLSQHAAFQAMWLQYDHLVPHARGGDNSSENMLITCAPCNFGRMNYTIDEVGLENPFIRPPIQSAWDGLERFLLP